MSESSSIDELVAKLRHEIARLSPGERLPSSRDLVARHGVSPVTVSRAIAKLAAEGEVVTRPGSGTFTSVRRRNRDQGDMSWQSVVLATRKVDPRDLLAPPGGRAIPLAGGYLH